MNKIGLQYRPGTNDVGRRFHARAVIPFVLPLLGLVLAVASPGFRAQADPIEVDHFPNSRGVVEIQSPLGTVLDTVTVNGPTTVNVDLGSLGDGDADGLEQLQTEMVQMDLTGTSSVLGPVIVRLRDSTERPFQRTLGELEESLNVQAGRLDSLGDDPPLCVEHPTPPANCVDTTAYSFFDVYFEVQVGGNVLHNETPKKMEATITHKPPATGETYERPEAIRLYDEAGNPTNVWVAGTPPHSLSLCPSHWRPCGVSGQTRVCTGGHRAVRRLPVFSVRGRRSGCRAGRRVSWGRRMVR